MKQKVVIKVAMNGKKCRRKALKIAVGISGVESAGLGGEDKSQIEVTGDGVDAAELTTLLRKNVGYAELVSVAAVEEKKEETKEETKLQVWPHVCSVPQYVYGVYPVQEYHEPSSCSIL